MSDFTGNKISNTYQRLLQLSSSGQIADGTGSLVSLSEIKFSDGTTQVTAGGGGATGGGVFVNKGGGTFELTESVSTLKISAPLLPSDDTSVTIGSETAPFKEVFVDSGSLVVVSGSESSKIQFLDSKLQFDSDISASVVGELIGTSSFASTATTSSFSTTAQTAVTATTSSFSETAQTADTADVATTAQNTFATMSVSGQTEILADSTRDVLNLSGSDNVKITSDDSTDTITFDLQDNVNVKTLTAETYIVSSSVTNMTTNFSSGSTKFGDTSDDTHEFTGSVQSTNNNTFTIVGVDNGSSFKGTNSNGNEKFKFGLGLTADTFFGIGNASTSYHNVSIGAFSGVTTFPNGENNFHGNDKGFKLTIDGDVTASGQIFSGGKKLQKERSYNQESKIVDFAFISSRTASLHQIPLEHSENVFFNGLRLTKDSGSFEFDYSMSLNDKHIVFSSDITFKSGDFLTFQYEFEN